MSDKQSIAIILAVSAYGKNGLVDLPSCVKDGQAISKIITSTGRFAEGNILQVEGRVNSNTLKSQLSSFFSSKSNLDIGELFVYFSGHGEYQADDFFCLLSDYSPKALRQTSLEGSELDNLARNLNPDLYVKIIDSCHSGIRYIKSREDFNAYAKKFAASFKQLYFLFSSLSDQFSYGGNDLSRFTRYIVKALIDTNKETIRYKDLIDAVSDSMTNAGQTPYFVAQAAFTELFCNVTPEVKKALSLFISEDHQEIDVADKGELEELLERVKTDAGRYGTYEEARAAIENLARCITDMKLPEKISSFYEVSVATSEKALSHLRGVGSWLEQNTSNEQYFAEPTYDTKTRTKRVPLSAFASSIYLLGSKKNDFEEVQESYRELSGFRSTVELPYDFISVSAKELFPNIDPARCLIVPIVSKTNIRIFWGWYFYDYLDWERKRARSNVEWSTATLPLKTDLQSISTHIMDAFSKGLEEALVAKWKK